MQAWLNYESCILLLKQRVSHSGSAKSAEPPYLRVRIVDWCPLGFVHFFCGRGPGRGANCRNSSRWGYSSGVVRLASARLARRILYGWRTGMANIEI